MEFVLAQWMGIPNYYVLAVYAAGSLMVPFILLAVFGMTRAGSQK